MSSGSKKYNIAIFASGTGSNAKKIIEYFVNHPTINIALIVSNNAEAGVLQHALYHNIPFIIIERETFFRGNGYVDELTGAEINFIILAGFIWKIPASLLNVYGGRILNIHPALLPKFGGKGMYGLKVQEAVIAAGETLSGITIHNVDGYYDNGDIIFQATCEVKTNDTPQTLAQKIHTLEHRYYPEVIERHLKTLETQINN